jgi:ArsR family transcriptional regulator
MNDLDVVRALSALAQQTRLQIFRQLVVAGSQGMTPTRLAEALSLQGTALSFHLKELMHAGLITQERDGRNLIYRAAFSTMNELLAYLTVNCCDGQACELVEVSTACTTC